MEDIVLSFSASEFAAMPYRIRRMVMLFAGSNPLLIPDERGTVTVVMSASRAEEIFAAMKTIKALA